MSAYVKVATVSDVEPGKVKEITVNEKIIALCNVNGTFTPWTTFACIEVARSDKDMWKGKSWSVPGTDGSSK